MSSRLLHLKKSLTEEESFTTINKEKVFIVSDFTGLLLLNNFIEKDQESCLLIHENDISFEKRRRDFEQRQLLVRDEKVVEAIQEIFPSSVSKKFENEALFYKDQEFKSFNGRAKPHKLLNFEDYFIDRPWLVNCNLISQDLNFENNLLKGNINSISFDNSKWTIKLSNNFLVETENLYWGRSRKEFYRLLDSTSKNNLSDEETSFITGIEDYSLLNIWIKLDQIVKENSQTLFIPQSQTHDYGHYILDFHEPNRSESSQYVTANIIIQNRAADEVELGDKYKKLKRKVDRIFSGFSNYIVSEEINLFPNFLCKYTNDSIEKESEKLPHFIGPQALRRDISLPFIGNAFKSYEYHKNI